MDIFDYSSILIFSFLNKQKNPNPIIVLKITWSISKTPTCVTLERNEVNKAVKKKYRRYFFQSVVLLFELNPKTIDNGKRAKQEIICFTIIDLLKWS